jgi:hypothetical protein
VYDAISEWLMAVLPAGRYSEAQGQWVEDQSDRDTWYAVIQIDGGPAINVTDRRKNARLILLGPRNARQEAPAVLADIESVVQAALLYAAPCGAAHIRVMAEPSRPGYTTEDRAFTMLDLQITF